MAFFESLGNEFAIDHSSLHGPSAIPAMHMHPHYEALLIYSYCEQISIVNGQVTTTVAEPSLTIFAPFSMHQTHMKIDDRIERTVFYFGESLIQQMPEVLDCFRPYGKAIFARFLLSPDLLQQLTPYVEIIRRHRHDSALMKMTFLTVLYIVLKGTPLESSLQKKETSTSIETVIQYMAAHFRENLTAEQVCQHFSISRSKLNKDFQKYMPISFHQLMTDMKISHACYLLLNPQLDIKTVATELGFEKETYFYTFFKKETGLTPLQFRKQKKPIFYAHQKKTDALTEDEKGEDAV